VAGLLFALCLIDIVACLCHRRLLRDLPHCQWKIVHTVPANAISPHHQHRAGNSKIASGFIVGAIQIRRLRMSTNKPPRAVKKRSQIKTQTMGEKHFTKRNTATGRFMDQKADTGKFKGVRKEQQR
jgi:hypothetical protein